MDTYQRIGECHHSWWVVYPTDSSYVQPFLGFSIKVRKGICEFASNSGCAGVLCISFRTWKYWAVMKLAVLSQHHRLWCRYITPLWYLSCDISGMVQQQGYIHYHKSRKLFGIDLCQCVQKWTTHLQFAIYSFPYIYYTVWIQWIVAHLERARERKLWNLVCTWIVVICILCT